MPALDDYLTKQLYIEKNVVGFSATCPPLSLLRVSCKVTYRSLSRQFGLHVNAAKTELAKFHEQSFDTPTRAFATYLITGELYPTSQSKPNGTSTQTDDGMDVDSHPSTSPDHDEEEEDVPTTTLTLVGEQDLEAAKSRYARIFSIHVYCLSPSPLKDAGLICGPSAIVYRADAKDAPVSSIALGRVVGPDVKIGKAPSALASSSKGKAPAEPVSRKPTLKVKTEEAKKATPEASPSTSKAGSTSLSSAEKDKDKAGSAKPKASGKLDWSKAKKTPEAEKKDTKAKATTKVKKEEECVSPVEIAAKKTAKLELKDESPKDDGKRGVKRKAAPAPVSDSEEKTASSRGQEKAEEKGKKGTPTPRDIKLRKNRVLSDDEDDEEPAPARVPRKPKGKSRTSGDDVLESDAEKSLRAMMDIDDSLVEKASASRPPPKKAVEDSDVEMAGEDASQDAATPSQEPEVEAQDDDVAPKPKPRKRKEKKVVPVGRNGLKKRRVMKSRMTVDSKGYMVTEDYSSYESVDEEEPEEEAPKKGRGKKAAAAAPSKPKKSPSSGNAEKSEDEEKPTPAKSKPVARSGSTAAKSKKPAGAQGSLKDFFGKPKK
ncbi:DNA polymerase subunit Cdc27 [Trametes polyzona]|nr:DNA polymerase subunit Cdc27 [Trametes polyzona]